MICIVMEAWKSGAAPPALAMAAQLGTILYNSSSWYMSFALKQPSSLTLRVSCRASTLGYLYRLSGFNL